MSSLFSIQCTTCNARISVKSEVLIGQILACPRCGGMVLVERPEPVIVEVVQSEEIQTDIISTPNSLPSNPPQQDDLDTNVKFFPNTLTSSTDSGLLNVTKPVEVTLNNLNPLQSTPDLSPPTVSIEPRGNISETEIRKRTIMLSILIVLFIILVLTTCLLFVQKKTVDTDAVVVPPEKITDGADDGAKLNEKISEPTEKTDPIPQPPDNTPPPEIPTNNTPKTETKPNEVEPPPLFVPTPVKEPITETIGVASANSSDDSSDGLTENSPETIVPNSIDKYWKDLHDKNKGQLLGGINNSVKRIDIPVRLRQPIVGLNFDKVSLVKVIRVISELTEIPMSFNVDEIRGIGGEIDTPITGKFGAGSIGEILDKILAPLNLTALVENNQLTITALPEKQNELIEETIDVSDIVKGTTGEDQLTLQRLVEIIELLIDPVGFDISTGNVEGDDNKRTNNLDVKKVEPKIRIVGESIVINSNRRRIDGTIRVLEQIRMLRGLEQKTKIIEGSLAPEVFGWDNVDVPITLNYYRKTSLPIIFKQIEKIFGIIIVVDHKELHRVNLSFDQLQGTVRANKITLNEALEQLLASVDEASLTYRIVGSNIIELTTTHSAKQPDKMSVEVHTYAEAVLKFVKLNTAAQQREAVVQGQSLPPIPAPVYKIEKQTPKNNVTNNDSEETDNDDNKTPEQIVENLRAIIEPTSWNDVAKANNTIDKNNNKNLPDKGNIVIDHSSSCLIIRQTQPIQRQIRTWLNSVTGKLRP